MWQTENSRGLAMLETIIGKQIRFGYKGEARVLNVSAVTTSAGKSSTKANRQATVLVCGTDSTTGNPRTFHFNKMGAIIIT